MSGERVDLDDLRARATAAQESADYREDMQRKGMARWIMSPRRDGTVDVVIERGGADVFDRALEADARFAVAAQPTVVVALVDRLQALELALEEATVALENDSLNDYLSNAALAARDVRKKGVVLR